jgi:hypothetical protein
MPLRRAAGTVRIELPEKLPLVRADKQPKTALALPGACCGHIIVDGTAF